MASECEMGGIRTKRKDFSFSYHCLCRRWCVFFLYNCRLFATSVITDLLCKSSIARLNSTDRRNSTNNLLESTSFRVLLFSRIWSSVNAFILFLCDFYAWHLQECASWLWLIYLALYEALAYEEKTYGFLYVASQFLSYRSHCTTGPLFCPSIFTVEHIHAGFLSLLCCFFGNLHMQRSVRNSFSSLRAMIRIVVISISTLFVNNFEYRNK